MKSKYGLRALMVVYRNKNEMLSIKNIAERADVPQKFLESIMLELKHNGVVDSKRGIFGGYFLSQKPEEIKIGDLIRIFDGPLAPIRCASVTAYRKCDDCADEKTCEIRALMLQVRNAIANVLDNTTLDKLSDDMVG
ncbi:MAG: RrF2 family transcriptional regulator [Alphaproteobacteria bacterium]